MKATKCDRCGKLFVDGGKKVKIIDKRTSDLCDECMLLVDLEKLLNEYSCKQALKNLEQINLDIVLDQLGYEIASKVSIYGINDYPTLEKQGDIEILKELIYRYFNNTFDDTNNDDVVSTVIIE